LARGWHVGDELVVTELDHHGNVGPWEAVARDVGLVLHRIPFRISDGTLDLDRLAAAITRRPRLVAVGWASNALGTVTDVAQVCRLCRAAGVGSFVDAVHSAPHLLPDVAALGCDYLACSPYKFYGPHQGILFGRRELISAVDIPKLTPAPDQIPERIETGTLSHEAIAGTRAAIDFLAGIAPRETRRSSLAAGYDELHRRGRALFSRMWNGLGELPGVTRFGLPPDRPRTPTLGFVVAGVASSEVARRLADRGLFLSHGDFYAATVIERLGLAPEGLVRAGVACYTDDGEVERLIEAVAEVAVG
jgi:cysteine desulfurase family protein (TIGR01976 family)